MLQGFQQGQSAWFLSSIVPFAAAVICGAYLKVPGKALGGVLRSMQSYIHSCLDEELESTGNGRDVTHSTMHDTYGAPGQAAGNSSNSNSNQNQKACDAQDGCQAQSFDTINMACATGVGNSGNEDENNEQNNGGRVVGSESALNRYHTADELSGLLDKLLQLNDEVLRELQTG